MGRNRRRNRISTNFAVFKGVGRVISQLLEILSAVEKRLNHFGVWLAGNREKIVDPVSRLQSGKIERSIGSQGERFQRRLARNFIHDRLENVGALVSRRSQTIVKGSCDSIVVNREKDHRTVSHRVDVDWWVVVAPAAWVFLHSFSHSKFRVKH